MVRGGVSMSFTIKNENVEFEFITEKSISENDGVFTAEVLLLMENEGKKE